MTALGHAESPLGTILLSGDGEALTGLWFLGQKYEGAGVPENAPTDESLPVFENRGYGQGCQVNRSRWAGFVARFSRWSAGTEENGAFGSAKPSAGLCGRWFL